MTAYKSFLEEINGNTSSIYIDNKTYYITVSLDFYRTNLLLFQMLNIESTDILIDMIIIRIELNKGFFEKS